MCRLLFACRLPIILLSVLGNDEAFSFGAWGGKKVILEMR